MPSEDTKILVFNRYHQSDKAQFIIYTNLESLLKKVFRCKIYPEKSSVTKAIGHFSSGFSMSTTLSFKDIENKDDISRCKNCMKKFCISIREHAMKIINFKKKKMKITSYMKKAKFC